jgi:hypothetical protein
VYYIILKGGNAGFKNDDTVFTGIFLRIEKSGKHKALLLPMVIKYT